MASWEITAVTFLDRPLRVRFDGERIVSGLEPGSPEQLLLERRATRSRPVRVTHTGPFAVPTLEGESWQVFCTALEAIVEWVDPSDVTVTGDPELPVPVPVSAVSMVVH